MKKVLWLLLLGFNGFIHAQEFPVLKGDYFGQTPPGDTPMIFAPGIVSGDDQEHGVPAFSPDGNEVFWVSNRPPGSENKEWLSFGKTMRRVGDKWTAPESSPFGGAVFSPDGKRLYMGSEEEGQDVTYAEKQDTCWSEPKPIGLISRFPELKFAYFPSIARNGTLYFMGYAEGRWINLGIYRSEFINGEYTKPELLPSSINSPGNVRNWVPYISPDESYLIFCSTRGLPSSDQGDLFISFRNPYGSWTEPANMGSPINTNKMERFSCLSPDGKYLFFTRDFTNNYEDIFWVSAKVIDDIRKEVFIKEEYFGQTPPGDNPLVFAPGIVSTLQHEHCAPAFTPDGKEIYWSVIRRSNDSTFQHIMFSEFKNDLWTTPRLAPFSSYKFYEGGPVISSDGKRLYIYRGMPAAPGGNARVINILCYTREGNDWVNPVNLGEGVFHSVTKTGTIYYTSIKNGISRRAYKNNSYSKPEVLNEQINLPGTMNWTPFIAPDESYLIFSSNRKGSKDDYGDLYISFRNSDGSWTNPVNLGEQINSNRQERFPAVSPDGKYLFFTRDNPPHHDDVFWVSAGIIEKLKAKAIQK